MNFKYLVQRSALTVLLIFLTITVIFFFIRLMPGDIIDYLASSGASQEQIDRTKELWGLDKPLYVQYIDFMINLVQGNAGISHQYRQPVFDVVKPRLMNSLVLLLPAVVVNFLVGSSLGAVIGTRVGSRLEKYGIVIPTMFGTVPEFFMGIVLLTLFAGGVFDFFPTGGLVTAQTYADNPWSVYFTLDFLWHYTLPFLTLTLGGIYYSMLVMRSSIVEVSGQDFMFYHQIKGIPRRTRLLRLMRHASLPVVTVLPGSFTTIISGSVLIELIFNWPGMGLLLIESTLLRDFPVIQVIFAVLATMIIVGNFLVDILYGILDPRVTVGQ